MPQLRMRKAALSARRSRWVAVSATTIGLSILIAIPGATATKIAALAGVVWHGRVARGWGRSSILKGVGAGAIFALAIQIATNWGAAMSGAGWPQAVGVLRMLSISLASGVGAFAIVAGLMNVRPKARTT